MRDFPQELVDLVIDKLAEPSEPGEPHVQISDYSTISRQWCERVRKHHFDTIFFHYQPDVEKWRRAIEPDPSGVSRHVRKIIWLGVDSLLGFDEHLRAFTRVVDVMVADCGFFHSPFQLEFFGLLGSSLEKLEVTEAFIQVLPLAYFLAVLPHLRQLCFHNFSVLSYNTELVRYLPAIPAFESANSLDLSLRNYLPGNTDWIPPTARFSDLRIDVSCIYNNHGLVNQWLCSSAGSLEKFTIHEGGSVYQFPRLDLSACASLRFLQFPVPVDQPQIYATSTLPLVSSSRLCRIILHMRGRKSWRGASKSWEEVDGHLTRLAKRFKDANGGKKMEVWAVMSEDYDHPTLQWLNDEWPMPSVKKEAAVAVLEWTACGHVADFYNDTALRPPL